ncbi:phenylacetaldoxime dehydratase [Trematosphaeria pertusa]|uniref:Phenylacetaldoxime dehydratase n=1 Tax=Trematosphaeria pertusa TaxID=390896 RepID=A0A6A6I9E2_9PLEO|nr:phenylacetaldoxime dehydratase [Trematosphaeria pertusa]KAF2247194.1 phenylacetaldoxime dehydratase [Trematosphaeria pertusa]
MASSDDLESAISQHLLQPHTIPSKPSSKAAPPYPSYVNRFPSSITDIAMAVLGLQYPSSPSSPTLPTPTLTKLLSFVTSGPSESLPSFWEPSSYTDAGYFNIALIAYWPSTQAFRDWKADSGFGAWWDALDAETLDCGYFLEAFLPSMERFETVLSRTDIREGSAHMRDSISGAVKEHAYWGSMRDRLPAAQGDELAGEKGGTTAGDKAYGGDTDTSKRRIRIPGRKNLTMIRSGQDWSSTTPEERDLYLSTMHPVLIAGMDFLRDEGEAIGCYSCRFMSVLSSATFSADTERTFGLAYFDELASLETWCKGHKTHLDIFGRFHKYAKELGEKMKLKLWHEVAVLEPGQQVFEYVGCHGKTGMLATLG